MEEKVIASEGKREPGYKMEEMEMTKDDLGKFELIENQRKTRDFQVNNIVNQLWQGKHFESPWVINKINGKYRIIDGGHRYKAVEIFLKGRPLMKVRVKLAVYKNLTPEEEKEVYTTWSLGIRQTIDDLLNLMQNDIKFLHKLIKAGIPVTIYRDRKQDKIAFRMIIGLLHSSHNTGKDFSTHLPKRDAIIQIANDFTDKHLDEVVRFFKIFRDVYGDFGNNYYVKMVFMNPLYNLYYLNQNLPDENLIQRFKNCVSDADILAVLHGHSRESMMKMREKMVLAFNRNQETKIRTKKEEVKNGTVVRGNEDNGKDEEGKQTGDNEGTGRIRPRETRKKDGKTASDERNSRKNGKTTPK